MAVFDQQLDALKETWGLNAKPKAKAAAKKESGKPSAEDSESDLYPDDGEEGEKAEVAKEGHPPKEGEKAEVAKEAKVDDPESHPKEDEESHPKKDEESHPKEDAAELEDPAVSQVAEPQPQKRLAASLRAAAKKKLKQS
eukprot:5464066-Amphidinium_carterae.1